MTVSRLDKLAREFSGEASIASASQKRNQPFHIVLAEDNTGKVAVMAHAAVDLALRCLKGKIFIYLPEKIPVGIRWRGGELKHQLLSLETLYGTENRIEFIDRNPPSSGLVLRLGAAPGNGVIADAVGWVAGIDMRET